MQELAKSHASLPDVDELTHTLRELVPQVARHGTFNFLLSQGDALWAHCSTHLHHLVRQHPFGVARLQDQDVEVVCRHLVQHSPAAPRAQRALVGADFNRHGGHRGCRGSRSSGSNPPR